MVRNLLQEQEGREGGIRRNSYVIDVDRRRNCCSCKEFDYFMGNYRNWNIVGQERRIEYKDNVNHRDNLKEEKSLIVLN